MLGIALSCARLLQETRGKVTERETSRKRNTEAEGVLLVFCVKSKELCVGTVKKGKVRGKRKNEKTPPPYPPPLETVVSRPDR